MRLKYIITLSLALCDLVFGGAWTRKAGKIFLAPYYYFYQAESYYDGNWRIRMFDNSGYFDSNTLGLYLEYGITDGLNLIGNSSFISNRWIDNFSYKSNFGFGDIELGLKLKIFESRVILGVQFTAIIPAYSVDEEPMLGFGRRAGEVRILFSGGAGLFKFGSYFNIEVGFRKFQKDVASQARFQILYGVNFSDRLQGLIQLDGVNSVGRGSFATKFYPLIETNYVEGKLSVSAAYRFIYKSWLQFGFYYDIYGKKIGVGRGFFITSWIDI